MGIVDTIRAGFAPLRSVATQFAPARKAAPRPASSPMLYDDYALDRIFVGLTSLPDPDEMLKKAGIKRAKLRIMEHDDEISAAIETRREALLATPWRLEPGAGDAVEFVAGQIARHYDTMLRGMWSALPYGYSVLEAVYELLPGGRAGLARCEEKPFEWFEPRQDGKLIYRPTDGRQAIEVDTNHKFFVTRHNPTYRNPYGEALLSRLYWPWQFRHNAWRFWMQFIERFGDPLLLGKSADPQAMVDALQRLGVQSILAVGTHDELSAVTQSGAGEFERIEAALNRRIQRVILGQTLTSDVGDKGSYAAAKVHDQVRQEKRAADIRMVSTTMQRIVDSVWVLNRFAGESPRFVLGQVAGIETERANRDAVLANAGIVRFTEDYLLRVYDYTAGDITIPSPEPRALPEDGLSAEFAPRTSGQDAVDRLTDDAIDRVPDAPVPLSVVREAVLKAENPDDLIRRLTAIMDERDPRYAETLERAMFAAEVLGYITVHERK